MRQAGVLRYGNPYPRGPGQPPAQSQSSRIATTRAGAAGRRRSATGSRRPVNPVGGRAPRLTRRSIWRVGQVGLVGGPEDPRLAALAGLLGLHVQRRVPAPGVDAHHPHAAVEQPMRRLGGDARARARCSRARRRRRRGPCGRGRCRAARSSWPARSSAASSLRGGHRVAVGLGRRCRARRPARENHSSGSSSIVCARSPRDRRVVVPGRVDVGRVVGAEAGERPRPPSPPRRAAGRAGTPEHAPRSRAAPSAWRDELDVGAQRLRVAPAGWARSARRGRRSRIGADPIARYRRRPGTRPPSAPASVAGPRGAAIPSTRIAFRPSESFSRPSVEPTSSPLSSRTRSSR